MALVIACVIWYIDVMAITEQLRSAIQKIDESIYSIAKGSGVSHPIIVRFVNETRDIRLETTQFASAVGVLTCTDSLLVANAGFEEGGLYSDRIVGREMPAELQRMIRNTHSSNKGKMSLMRHTRSSRSAHHQWMRALLMKHLTRSDSKVEGSASAEEAP